MGRRKKKKLNKKKKKYKSTKLLVEELNKNELFDKMKNESTDSEVADLFKEMKKNDILLKA